MDIFVLVIGMFGLNGDQWVFMGNQLVIDLEMTKSQCERMSEQIKKFSDNDFLKFAVRCFKREDMV
tara:strand:+ start:1367 stop:1564 length:198 start_codon:yes stop_codon:yes gene_type:complete